MKKLRILPYKSLPLNSNIHFIDGPKPEPVSFEPIKPKAIHIIPVCDKDGLPILDKHMEVREGTILYKLLLKHGNGKLPMYISELDSKWGKSF
jgi:hypothetical protein